MRLFIAIALSSTLCSTSFGEESKVKDEELPAVVLQGIADLSLLRDEVVQRYVLMVTGETVKVYDERVKRAPLVKQCVYKLQAIDKKDAFRYIASGKVMGPENSNRGYDFQFWTELYQCGLVIKGRSDSAGRVGYFERKKGQSTKDFIEENNLSWLQPDPFDDLVLHAMFLSHPMDNSGWIEQVYLVESKLLSAETIAQGDIRSTWRWKKNRLDFEIELTQSKAFDYLPTHVKYTSMMKAEPSYFSETEIKWKKHAKSGKFLPHIIKAATGSPYGHTEEHHHWVFDWRLGDEIPANFFDRNSEDFRLKFSPLYDFYFDTDGPGGIVTGTQWKTPGEILPEH